MSTLLEEAKNRDDRRITKSREITQELIPLAIGWLTSEVTHGSFCAVTGTTSGSYTLIARALREAYNQGVLVVKEEL